ncbi:MAG: hypothetical protein HKN23_05385, partial [Verrucomicrobiales bacterium]|nr:hypothetical protein [Verrucomicrobiales bacterium]
PKLARESGRGLVKPGFTATLDEPGKYTVWLHTYSVIDGTAYEHGDRLPTGAEVVLTEQPGNRPVVLNRSIMASSKSFGADTAVAVGTFESRGGVTIEVGGTGFPKPAVLSVAPQKIGDSFRVILTIAGILIACLFFAIVSLIILLHRRAKMVAQNPGA